MPSYLADCQELLARYYRWRGELPTGSSGGDATAAPDDHGSATSHAGRAGGASPPPPPLPTSALVSMLPRVEGARQNCHRRKQQQEREREQQEDLEQQEGQKQEEQKQEEDKQPQQKQQRRKQSRKITAVDSAAQSLSAPSPPAFRGRVGSGHDGNPGVAAATAAAADDDANVASAATEAAFYSSAAASLTIAAATTNAVTFSPDSVAAAAATSGGVCLDTLTPPLALRTRSSRRRRRGGGTALRHTLEPSSEPTRRGSGPTTSGVEAGVEAEAETEGETPFARFSRMTVSSSPLPPSEELLPVRLSTERDETLPGAKGGRTEEEGRYDDTDARQWNRQGQGQEEGQGVGQGQTPRGRKQSGRTKKLVIGVEAGDGAAEAAGGVARRVGAGRRAVALGKRWVRRRRRFSSGWGSVAFSACPNRKLSGDALVICCLLLAGFLAGVVCSSVIAVRVCLALALSFPLFPPFCLSLRVS